MSGDNPDLMCIRGEFREHFEKQWASKKPGQIRAYLHTLWEMRDNENPNAYCRRILFCDPPPPMRDTDPMPVMYPTPLLPSDFLFYSDGVRSDSPDGLERSRRNAAEVARIIGDMSADRALRDTAKGKALERARSIATSEAHPMETRRKASERVRRLQRELDAERRPVRAWDFCLAEPVEMVSASGQSEPGADAGRVETTCDTKGGDE